MNPQRPAPNPRWDDASSFTMSSSGIATPSSTASMGDVGDEPPPVLNGEHPFRDAKVAFAIDVSGSTYGQTLMAEQSFIKSIGQQLSAQARFQARILPWSSSASRIMGISQVSTLYSSGGTAPTVILADSSQRRVLAQSSVWFLMTDGLIDTSERLRFARMLAEKGVHGTSCVVVIFERMTGSGWSGDISVGVSVFAVVPNCAFILYDLCTGDMRLLQAKGIFRCLLRGREPPVFEEGADLKTFPPVIPSDFCDIVARMPQKLEADQVALQDAQVVNMEDLFANRLAEAEVANIMSNEDNLASVIMTAQSRGQAHKFQGWVQQQRLQNAEPTTAERHDVGGAAQRAFTELIALQQRGHSPSATVQTQLRLAHAANMTYLEKAFRARMTLTSQRDRLFAQALARSTTRIDSAASLRHTSTYGPEEKPRTPRSSGDLHMAAGPSPAMPTTPAMAPMMMRAMMPATMPATMAIMPRLVHPFELEDRPRGIPEFRPGTGSFTETCPLCLTANVTLSLLFKRGSSVLDIPPLLGNALTGDPSLHMGESSKFDILSSTICCDACSSLCVRLRMSTDRREVIYAALPLVPWTDNARAFGVALPLIFGASMSSHRPDELLLSVVLTALGRPDLSSVLRGALIWFAKDLLRAVHSTWGAPSQSHPSKPLGTIMQESMADPKNALLLKFHMHTFVLTLRGAGLLGTPMEVQSAAALRRLLYSVCEGLAVHWQLKGLMRKDDRAQAASLFFRPVLHEQLAGGHGQTRPVFCISPASVEEKGLMMKGAFVRLRQAEEFGDLLGPSHALALLLHILCQVMSRGDGPDLPLEIFAVFEAEDIVQKAMRCPGIINESDVAAIAV